MITDVVSGLGAGVGVDVSPDGATAYVVEWSNGELIRVDTLSGAVETIQTGLAFPQDVIVNWTTGQIFVSERTGSIREVFGQGESEVIDTFGGAPHQLALSQDGNRLYSVTYDSGEIHLLDLTTGTSVVLLGGLGHPVGLVIDPAETTAYVTEQDGGSLTVVDLGSGTVTARNGGLVAPFFLAWDKDGTGLYCIQRDPSNALVHLPLGPVMVAVAHTSGLDWRPSGVAPTPDDGLIFVATDRKLQVISVVPIPPPVPPPAPFVVETVRFEDDRGDAIPVQFRGSPVPTPEWVLGGHNYPAAYPMGTLVRVEVRLRRQAGYVPGNYAIGATGNHGGIRRATITPVFDPSGFSAPITLEFMWPLPGSVETLRVTLDWYARPTPAPGVQVGVGSTSHPIYTLLRRPTVAPWTGSRLWVKALDRACSWAAGSSGPDEAAAAITAGYNGSGVVSYDTLIGATAYGTGQFVLTQMLERLAGGIGLGDKVNCTDSANTVSTLANVLGCELWQSQMGSFFGLNPVIAIGYKHWEVPFDGSFSYHEVAWKGGANVNDPVFDGCLHVDSDTDPTTAPHTALLPVNMLFGDCGALNYRRRLCPPAPGGCAACQPQPGATRKRRPIV